MVQNRQGRQHTKKKGTSHVSRARTTITGSRTVCVGALLLVEMARLPWAAFRQVKVSVEKDGGLLRTPPNVPFPFDPHRSAVGLCGGELSKIDFGSPPGRVLRQEPKTKNVEKCWDPRQNNHTGRPRLPSPTPKHHTSDKSDFSQFRLLGRGRNWESKETRPN